MTEYHFKIIHFSVSLFKFFYSKTFYASLLLKNVGSTNNR